jgi:serine O-acetyltransferase
VEAGGKMTRMKLSLSVERLCALAQAQIENFFPDGEELMSSDFTRAATGAMDRLEHCFSYIDNRYFFDGKQAIFNHLHGDQYAMWLYFLGNELYRRRGPETVCSKLFLLNKALHGCDIYYEVALPEIFLLVHPLGTVLGRGNYSNYFVSYQRCGVGSNHDVFPSFGEYVTMRPGSAVLGSSKIGNNCQIATESLVIDRDIPDNSLYIGNPKTATIKEQSHQYPLWRT